MWETRHTIAITKSGHYCQTKTTNSYTLQSIVLHVPLLFVSQYALDRIESPLFNTTQRGVTFSIENCIEHLCFWGMLYNYCHITMDEYHITNFFISLGLFDSLIIASFYHCINVNIHYLKVT